MLLEIVPISYNEYDSNWVKFVRISAKLRPSHADGQLVRLYRNFDPRLLTKSVTVACKALIIDWAFCQRVASRMFWRLWCQSQALFCLRQIRAWTSISHLTKRTTMEKILLFNNLEIESFWKGFYSIDILLPFNLRVRFSKWKRAHLT